GVIAAQAGTAYCDSACVYVAASFQVVDAGAYRYLVVVAVVDVVLAQRRPLAGAVHQQAGDAALERAPADHEIEFLLERVEAAERDKDGAAVPRVVGHRTLYEMPVQHLAILVRDLDLL